MTSSSADDGVARRRRPVWLYIGFVVILGLFASAVEGLVTHVEPYPALSQPPFFASKATNGLLLQNVASGTPVVTFSDGSTTTISVAHLTGNPVSHASNLLFWATQRKAKQADVIAWLRKNIAAATGHDDPVSVTVGWRQIGIRVDDPKAPEVVTKTWKTTIGLGAP